MTTIEKSEFISAIKPCPKCGKTCHPIETQQLKLCSDRKDCKWKDDNWQRDKDQPPVYG